MSSQRRRSEERRIAEERSARWSAELAARYGVAAGSEQRVVLLAEMDRPYVLDEAAALALYSAQPELSSGFIQRHLPRGRRAEDASPPWERLMAQAAARGDMPLYFALYRIQASAEQWSRDTAHLADEVAQPDRLCPELERRHPQRWRPDIGLHLAVLALRRGKDLLPYLLAHAADVWSPRRREGFEPMLDLSRRNGWWELWSLLLHSAAISGEYEREVTGLVSDQTTAEADLRERLLLLAGGLRETPLRLRHLKEATLANLYRRFPELARDAFDAQLEPSSSRPLLELLELALARGDEQLIDTLAARLAVRVERSGGERLMRAAALAEAHLRAAQAVTSGRRIVAILLRIPAGAMRAQAELFHRNPLTRLLYERASKACIDEPELAARLLQAPNASVRALAVRVLANGDDKGNAAAQQHLELLLDCLEQPLPRAAARSGVRLLDRLADQPARAQRIAQWARAMLQRTKVAAPVEELVALLGHQLARFPVLQGPQEHVTVYRKTAG